MRTIKTACFKPYYVPGRTAKAFDDVCKYLGVSSGERLTEIIRKEIAPYVNDSLRFDLVKAKEVTANGRNL